MSRLKVTHNIRQNLLDLSNGYVVVLKCSGCGTVAENDPPDLGGRNFYEYPPLQMKAKCGVVGCPTRGKKVYHEVLEVRKI